MDTKQLIDKQRAWFMTQATRSYAFRKASLLALQKAVARHESDILAALKSDLNKSATEAYMTEITVLNAEIKYVLAHLRRWMKPQRVKTNLMLMPARCYRMSEPYGVVLILSPWNYPLLLSLEPLVTALAAGNCAIIKPSAYAPATSHVVAQLVAECFPPHYCAVVEGGRAENADLLQQTFDYIFFTGGVTVGKLVMESASRHVTPVSLELGGKSPVIVDQTARLDLAAKRIVFGKFINAGQTCVAPDYVLVQEDCKEALIERMIHWIQTFYPLQGDVPAEDYPRIVNQKHFDRLMALVEDAAADGEGAVWGGGCNRSTLTIAPTLLPRVTFDKAVMQEEIFGPLLPIISYKTLDQAISWVQARPKPLALYVFTSSKEVKNKVLQTVSFGGGCVNDTLMHVATSHLPFGGVGQSGMGSYHGKAGYDTFSHYKSMVDKGVRLDPSLRYRPYGPAIIKWLKKL